MRRAERLFQLIQLIRGRRLSTAAFLATRLEVSQRSVRSFRVDRMQHVSVLPERFRDEPGKTLVDLLRNVTADV